MSDSLRNLPAVHRLLDSPSLAAYLENWGRTALTGACREVLDDLRAKIERGENPALDQESVERAVAAALERSEAPSYAPVVNATGVLLHTNLGRAPTAPAGQDLGGYLALEFDVRTGARGQRLTPLRNRIAEVCGGESAVMVNNNAASLLLILSVLAAGREVIVSRSQLIEIGGSFRLPAVMEAAGCRLVEVGCTNRTHLKDFAAAVTDRTAAILVAHQSNFRIVGFTTEPSTGDLADLAHDHGLPFIVDQGSGCLHDLSRWGLPKEETVGDLLAAGADVVCFSGDKLLGGPQAGIAVGRRDLMEKLAKHPLYRALRPDKTALVHMDRVLRAHQTERLDEIPLYAMLGTSADELTRRADRLRRRLRKQGVPAKRRPTRATLGGGTTPEETLASSGLELEGGRALLDCLREENPVVVGRLEDDRVVLDLRTVLPTQDRALGAAVESAYIKATGGHNRQAAGSQR